MSDNTAKLEIPSNDQSPSIYREQSGWVVRASSLGRCIRSLVLTARQFYPAPYPPGITAAMSAGNDWEQWAIDYMQRLEDPTDFLSGWALNDFQRGYDLQLLPDMMVRCHIDAKGSTYSAARVVEIKSFGEKLCKMFLDDLTLATLPHYAYQLSIQMLAVKLPGLFVVVDKSSEDPNDPFVYYNEYHTPPISKGQILARLATIKRWLTDPSLQDQLPACDNGDTGFCPFYNYHDKPESGPAPKSVDKQIEQLIAQWDRYGEDIRLLTKERDKVKSMLLDTIGTDSPVTANGKTFGFYTESNGVRWDMDSLLALVDELSPGLDLSPFRTDQTRTMPRYQ